jgi:hypothetical protein
MNQTAGTFTRPGRKGRVEGMPEIAGVFWADIRRNEH